MEHTGDGGIMSLMDTTGIHITVLITPGIQIMSGILPGGTMIVAVVMIIAGNHAIIATTLLVGIYPSGLVGDTTITIVTILTGIILLHITTTTMRGMITTILTITILIITGRVMEDGGMIITEETNHTEPMVMGVIERSMLPEI